MTLAENKPKKLFTANSLTQAVKMDGRDLIIFDSKVYDLSKFSKYHPGGQLAIKHMAGKDATGAIYAFHTSKIIDEKLPKFYAGEFLRGADMSAAEVDDIIVSRIASDDLASNDNESCTTVVEKDYILLKQRLIDDGFYKPSYMFYIWRLALFACTLSTAVGLLHLFPSSVLAVISSALFMGFTWHGLSFSAHDAGHHSITTDRILDTYIGIFIADFVGGLSIGWWKYNHNIHHIVTNDPEHDPDIQHMPMFAITSKLFNNLYSSFHQRVMTLDLAAKFLISIQHYLFIPILSFGRFNLYAQSMIYLFRSNKSIDPPRHRYLELTGLAFFWFWYGYLLVYLTIPTWPLRLLFVWLSHASTIFLHLQITLSHFAMSTELDGNESFAEKALRTTMNVDCPKWFDWFHGGLQFQIEHHLFPRIPRCHFRRLQPIIKEFCLKHGLKYHSHGFIYGNGLVLGTLRHVAHQVRHILKSTDTSIGYKET